MTRFPAILCGLCLVTTICTSTLLGSTSSACTAFLLEQDQQKLVGKSYDWEIGHGQVLINKRNLQKRALLLDGQKPLQWVSTQGSLTFNQYGREMPNGGINESGLVIEVLWLDNSVYAPKDTRLAVNELQWIQYMLDTAKDVPTLIAQAKKIRIAPAYARVHYFACDAKGQCAALEMIKGDLVITSGADMPVKTLTNHSYADSARYLKRHKGFGGAQKIKTGTRSLDRFTRAAHMTRSTPITSKDGFHVLDQVKLGNRSQWNILYDPQQKAVWFRTRDSTTIKRVALSDFDLQCQSPTMVMDIQSKASGDVHTNFVPYTRTLNEELLAKSLQSIAPSLPKGTSSLLARYPETMTCKPSR